MDDRQQKLFDQMTNGAKNLPQAEQDLLKKDLIEIFETPGVEQILMKAMDISYRYNAYMYVFQCLDVEKQIKEAGNPVEAQLQNINLETIKRAYIISDVPPSDPLIRKCWKIEPDGHLVILEKVMDKKLTN